MISIVVLKFLLLVALTNFGLNIQKLTQNITRREIVRAAKNSKYRVIYKLFHVDFGSQSFIVFLVLSFSCLTTQLPTPYTVPLQLHSIIFIEHQRNHCRFVKQLIFVKAT